MENNTYYRRFPVTSQSLVASLIVFNITNYKTKFEILCGNLQSQFRIKSQVAESK